MKLLTVAEKVDVTPETAGSWVTVTAPASLDGLSSVIVELTKSVYSTSEAFGIRPTGI